MSLLSSITSGVKQVSGLVKTTAQKAAAAVSGTVQKTKTVTASVATSQKPKLENVGATLKAAVTGKGVVANTPSPTVNKVLSAAASNPLTTAGIAAAVVNPAGAAKLAKTVTKALPTKAKVAAVVAAPVVAGVVVSNPGLIKEAAKAPGQLASFGSDVGTLTKKPSLEAAKKLVKESPVITTALGAAGLGLVGAGVGGVVASVSNTLAVKESTKATKAAKAVSTGAGLEPEAPTLPQYGPAPIPLTPSTQVIGKEVSKTSQQRRTASTRRAKEAVNRQYVRVNVLNANQSRLYSRTHTRYN